MPNWCTNELFISGSTQDLKQFIQQHLVEEHLDFNTIVPMPLHQPDTSKPNAFFAHGGLGIEERQLFGVKNWYDWSLVNWGTKWNANDTYYYFYDDHIDLYFSTAWSPPIDLMYKLSSMHPELEILYKYIEEGVGFAGEILFVDGEVDYDVHITGDDYLIYAYRRNEEYYLDNAEDYDDSLEVFQVAGETEMVEAILQVRALAKHMEE